MRTLIIFGDLFTLPQFGASASTNRVQNLASGLIANDINTIIVAFSNIYGQFIGISNNIEYYIPLEQKVRNNYLLIRRFHKLKKYLNTFQFLKIKKKTSNLESIILYSRTPNLFIFLAICSRILGIKLILEVTEMPTKDFGKYSIIKPIFPHFFLKFFDGFTCISSVLQEYCERYKNKKAKTILLPPVLNDEDFNIIKTQSDYDFEYILYSGTLSFQRDGIDILIEAFDKVCKQYPKVRLVLGGKWIDEATRENALNLTKKRGIEDRVIFSGFLSVQEIKSLISNAKILCVPRKNCKETRAAFPTKLVEYLATGIPVLTTSVGDISNYLEDQKNAYLAEPDNIDSLSSKLIYIISNYEKALQVGQASKKMAMETFGNIKCTYRIVQLLNEFI